jgi:hypothetical protein
LGGESFGLEGVAVDQKVTQFVEDGVVGRVHIREVENQEGRLQALWSRVVCGKIYGIREAHVTSAPFAFLI